MILTSVAIVSYNMFLKLSDFWFYCLYCLTADFVDLIAFFLKICGQSWGDPSFLQTFVDWYDTSYQ